MDMSQEQFIVLEEQPDHSFRTEIPNIIFDILPLTHIGVYGHLKKIAGDGGACWQSKTNLAKKLGISKNTLLKIIADLEEGNNPMKLKLIRQTKRTKANGDNDSSLIVIINIWADNGKHCRLQKKGSAKIEPPLVQNLNYPSAKFEHKEDPSEEDLSKRSDKRASAVAPVKDEKEKLNQFVKLKKYQITLKDINSWLKKYSFERIRENLLLLSKEKEIKTTHARWMEKALKEDYAQQRKNVEINKKWLTAFKSAVGWKDVTITKTYATHAPSGKDFQFKIDPDRFSNMIKDCYEKY